ncbi:unnamed protein product [Rotaria sp. Silwood1]|nr:unnamed protein product [Rotaria sp. Silwood1]
MHAPPLAQVGKGGYNQVKEKQCYGCCTSNQIGIFIEQKRPKTRPASPVVQPRSPVTPTSLPLVSTPPMVPTPSPILPPAPLALPNPPAPPTIPSSSTPSVFSPPPTLPSQSPAAQVSISGSSAQSTPPTTTKDTLSTLTKVTDQLNVSSNSSISDEVRVCTINRKTEPSGVSKLRRQQREALEEIDMELENLNGEFKLVQTNIKGTDDEIKLAERQKEQAERQKKQAEYQKQLAEIDMEIAEVKRRNAERDKYTYETRALQITQGINQAKTFWVRTNQKWLYLINERLRQDQENHRG